MEFEEWLRTACFQKPTPEAYDLAKVAWNAATNGEREACAKVCDMRADMARSDGWYSMTSDDLPRMAEELK